MTYYSSSRTDQWPFNSNRPLRRRRRRCHGLSFRFPVCQEEALETDAPHFHYDYGNISCIALFSKSCFSGGFYLMEYLQQ